ncbi:Piso0_000233 [Millerozyma farinosa CBS 7064]|uniref:Peptide hydrolase n=1 Tax=Pichia sorbitophila (strain ATCC MYA-4447 / BCRC 22081 / CBS 7064 / NBRC 10061 / NRRL Y-12695) TaxID=559304 RepID=G8YUW1_PICSO|nr:Piso0_000233 [Millerozyma farinosa CBS 7064]
MSESRDEARGSVGEATSLLSPYEGDANSNYGSMEGNQSHDASEVSSKLDEFQKKVFRFSKRRFWWSCFLGMVCLLIMHLSFLPRTSLSRDLRRLHGMRLTKSDVQFNFLYFTGLGYADGNRNEEYVNSWLKDLSTKSGSASVNYAGCNNDELVNYVERVFRDLGFTPTKQVFTNKKLKKPVHSSLRLIDKVSGQIIYDAPMLEKGHDTPAFFTFGKSGKTQQEYIYVNEGTVKDYETLKNRGFSIEGKIVISKVSELPTFEKLRIAERSGAVGALFYIPPSNSDIFSRRAFARDYGGARNTSDLDNIITANIPAAPISYESIEPILETLGSNDIANFDGWNFYPEEVKKSFVLELSTEFDDKSETKMVNIEGTIKGIFEDGEIIIGASRDSLTNSNPLSNHAVLFDILRNIQKIRKLGWKPWRTIRFISWDGSHSALSGSTHFLQHFQGKSPILAYVNLDSSVVAGSNFQVDATPYFNQILMKTSRYIPLEFSLDKRDAESDNNKNLNSAGKIFEKASESPESILTLYDYWKRQDNITISNLISQNLKNNDAVNFQNAFNTPIINVKFSNNALRDPFFQEGSNYFSYNWFFQRNVDPFFILHGSLIRYIGLLILTLAEQEVIRYDLTSYSLAIEGYYKDFLDKNNHTLNEWYSRPIDEKVIEDTKLLSDLKGRDSDSIITLLKVSRMFSNLLSEVSKSAKVFDAYRKNLELEYTQDFAWYTSIKKLKIYAQLKLTNYKFLRLEKELTLNQNDFEFLDMTCGKTCFNHIIYGVDSLYYRESPQNEKLSAFAYLYSRVQNNDFDGLVKYLAILYEKMTYYNKRLT